MKKNNRWYDRFPSLSRNLERLREKPDKSRTYVINNIIQIIRDKNPELLNPEHALDFPLDPKKRRWYDQDPYFWLLVNTLSKADEQIIEAVAQYFSLEISAL